MGVSEVAAASRSPVCCDEAAPSGWSAAACGDSKTRAEALEKLPEGVVPVEGVGGAIVWGTRATDAESLSSAPANLAARRRRPNRSGSSTCRSNPNQAAPTIKAAIPPPGAARTSSNSGATSLRPPRTLPTPLAPPFMIIPPTNTVSSPVGISNASRADREPTAHRGFVKIFLPIQ